MITGVLIKTDKSGNGKNTATRISFDDELENYYKYLECDCIEIIRRPIGGKEFTIVCDDMGWRRTRPLLSAISYSGKQDEMLVGNLFVCKGDGPELESLTPEECEHVMSYMSNAFAKESNKSFLIIG